MLALEEPLHVARRLTNRISGTIERGQEFHEEIFRAIVDSDASRARQTMRAHLELLWQTLLNSQAEKPGSVSERSGTPAS